MATDDGAQAILNLLNEPSEVLYQNMRILIKAQRKQADRPYGVMAQPGIDALAAIRLYYRDLRSQIDAIDTIDVASKAFALDALDSADRMIGQYESSLEFGISQPAIPKLKKAVRTSRLAKSSFKQAMEGLLQ